MVGRMFDIVLYFQSLPKIPWSDNASLYIELKFKNIYIAFYLSYTNLKKNHCAKTNIVAA